MLLDDNADYNYFYYNAVLVMYFDLLVLYMLHIIAILLSSQ